MRIHDRILRLAISLLLPALYVATSYFFVTASVALGETDRAIVWADGSPTQLQALAQRVVSSPQFPDGRVAIASTRLPLPESCGATAREYSIGSLGAEEAQAARMLLEALAADVGARICLTNVFIINELPSLSPRRDASFWYATLLQSMLLPLGIVLAMFLAFSKQLQLSLRPEPGSAAPSALGAGVLGAVASLALLLAMQGLGAVAGFEAPALPDFSVQALGLALTFALLLVVPALEELVFRGWMLPLAERALGPWAAAAVTSLAFAASRLPDSGPDALLQFALGGVYAAIYLRTRSLPACLLANALFSALAFLPMSA